MKGIIGKLKKNSFLLAVVIFEVAIISNSLIPECSPDGGMLGISLSTAVNRAYADVSPKSLRGSFPVNSGLIFNEPMLSMNFDDGWATQYSIAAPVLEAAKMKGGFYIITDESVQAKYVNRVENPGFELKSDEDKHQPNRWFVRSSGENDATSEYPAKGRGGTCGAKVSIADHGSGSVEWVFNDASVINDHDYKYANYHKSTATTTLYARYTYEDGRMETVPLATLPPAKDWTRAEHVMRIPLRAAFVTVFHSLEGEGSLVIDDVELAHVERYMSMEQAKELFDRGHEIQAHSKTHADLSRLGRAGAENEILGSRLALVEAGMAPQDVFVYPFGNYNQTTVSILKENGYIAARGVQTGFNFRNTPKYELKVQQVDRTTTFEDFKEKVDWAVANRAWVIFMFHQVDDQNEFYSGSPALFRDMVNYIASQPIRVVTLKEGVAEMLP